MNLYECMGKDWLWIAITVVLDVTIAGGYVLIALHWWRNARTLPPNPAKRALNQLRNIFVFCGICGYIFIPIKMVWPAWRLYDIFLAVLAWYTWRYAWGARDLRVVYNELGKVGKLAEDLQKSRDESNRKTLFLNAISHDLRTPLNGLTLQTNLAEIAAASSDIEMLRTALTDIRASARQTAAMLDTFLEVAQIDQFKDPNQSSNFSVDELVEEILQSFRDAADTKGVALKHQPCPGLIFHTDRMKLQRVLNNLVSNAIKFTNEGEIRIQVDASKESAEIHVIDTGIGIAQEHHDRLFEDFFQIGNRERDPQKGFGLGLAIARRLAGQVGGDVRFSTSAGRGSRFTIALPGVIGRRQAESATAVEGGVAN